MKHLLEVYDLRVTFRGDDNRSRQVVDGVSFAICPGEMVALVGESGSGKSLTALALPSLLPQGATVGESSRILFDGVDLRTLAPRELRRYRGARLGMVFQDPYSSLNPVLRVGDHLTEAILAHQDLPRGAARQRAVSLLAEVGIADPEAGFTAWPHQLSGGMRQRVMIATALAAEPELLIADEPTTALDVTVQAQVLELLDQLRTTRRMAVLLISHDLSMVAGRADRVMVMYAGRIIEEATTAALFSAPTHPYTRGLMAAVPRLDSIATRLTTISGTVPSPDNWPTGCRFHTRCPLAIDRCTRDAPPLVQDTPQHSTACWITAPPEES